MWPTYSSHVHKIQMANACFQCIAGNTEVNAYLVCYTVQYCMYSYTVSHSKVEFISPYRPIQFATAFTPYQITSRACLRLKIRIFILHRFVYNGRNPHSLRRMHDGAETRHCSSR